MTNNIVWNPIAAMVSEAFVAGIGGMLQHSQQPPHPTTYRATLHGIYLTPHTAIPTLLQLGNYVTNDPSKAIGNQRMLPVNHGIVGAAIINKQIYASKYDWIADEGTSYLAIPFGYSRHDGIGINMVLYVEVDQPNCFGMYREIVPFIHMCQSFCNFIDAKFINNKTYGIEYYPEGLPDMCGTVVDLLPIQEAHPELPIPMFNSLQGALSLEYDI